MIHKRTVIIGLLIAVGLTLRAGEALALYSPKLSRQAAIIRQHIRDSQAQNGSNTIMEEIEQIKAYDKAKREAFLETGNSGNVVIAQELIINSLNLLHPFDTLAMGLLNYNYVTNQIISTCLRDDIWGLEVLRDKVGDEMIKAFMLRDTYHGTQLMRDYEYLVNQLKLLRKFGSNPSAEIDTTDAAGNNVKITSTKYFFGNNGTDPNYYKNVSGWISNETGCPESEFQEAFREVVNASKTFATLSSGQGSNWDWDSIWAMAGQNARIRARQWIRANKLSLTLGGENGGRAENLVKGGGWDKFKGYWKSQWEIIKNMVGPVTPFYDAITNYKAPPGNEALGNNCRFYHQNSGYFTACNTEELEQYKKCQENPEQEEIRCDRFRNADESISMLEKLNNQARLEEERAQTLEDAQNAFTYSMMLDSVGEENLFAVDQIMWDLNMNIQRGYENLGKDGGESLPSLTRMVARIVSLQCANKQ